MDNDFVTNIVIDIKLNLVSTVKTTEVCQLKANKDTNQDYFHLSSIEILEYLRSFYLDVLNSTLMLLLLGVTLLYLLKISFMMLITEKCCAVSLEN